jgi:hypothetical protein
MKPRSWLGPLGAMLVGSSGCGSPPDAGWFLPSTSKILADFAFPYGSPTVVAMDASGRIAACGSSVFLDFNVGYVFNNDYLVVSGTDGFNTIHEPAQPCTAIAILTDGQIVTYGSWHTPSAGPTGTLALIPTPDGGVVARTSTEVVRYDVVAGNSIERWRVTLGSIQAATVAGAATAEPSLVVVASDTVRAYDLGTGAAVASFGTGGVAARSGAYDVFGYGDGVIAVVTAQTPTVTYLDRTGAVRGAFDVPDPHALRMAPLDRHRLAVQRRDLNIFSEVTKIGVVAPALGWSGLVDVDTMWSGQDTWYEPDQLVSDGATKIAFGTGLLVAGVRGFYAGGQMLGVTIP